MKSNDSTKIEGRIRHGRAAKIIKAEDIKAGSVSFEQLLSITKSDGSIEDLNLRPFKLVQVNQKKDQGSMFRQLFSDKQDNEQKQELLHQQKKELENIANEIIEDAKRQAAEIEEKARALEEEAHTLREEARAHGYKEGYHKGIEAGKKEIFEVMQKETDPLVQFLSNALNEISTLRDSVLDDMESNTLKLSLIIAKKLACRELSMHPDAIVDVVKTAIMLVEDRKRMVVKVNPLDLELVKKYRSDILHLIQVSSGDETLEDQDASEDIGINLVIEKDEAISRGGCVIETQTQSLDATFETRLEEIVDAILSGQEGKEELSL